MVTGRPQEAVEMLTVAIRLDGRIPTALWTEKRWVQAPPRLRGSFVEMRCSAYSLRYEARAWRPAASGGSVNRARPVSSGGRLLDPQSPPAGRHDVAVDRLAAVRRHEKVAAVALVVVLRAGLIMDRGLRDLGLRLAARQRQHGGGAGGGKKDGAAADAGCVASLAHERLLRR